MTDLRLDFDEVELLRECIDGETEEAEDMANAQGQDPESTARYKERLERLRSLQTKVTNIYG